MVGRNAANTAKTIGRNANKVYKMGRNAMKTAENLPVVGGAVRAGEAATGLDRAFNVGDT